jgi:hypothetical protein
MAPEWKWVAAWAAILLIVPAPALGADFMNFTYQPSCVTELPDSGLPKRVTVQDGEYETEPGMGATYFQVLDVTPVDLTGDGTKETVVETACGFRGANYRLLEYFIFPADGRRPEPTASLDTARAAADYHQYFPDSETFPLEQVEVRNQSLIATLYADGPHCCPVWRVTAEYRLESGELKLSAPPERARVEAEQSQ